MKLHLSSVFLQDGSENIKESTSITKEIHISGDQVPDWIAYIATLDLKWCVHTLY